ncbi:MAG: alpha/beta hydrolase [Thermomicrobiales bacterium]
MPFFGLRATAGNAVRRFGIAFLLLSTLITQNAGLQTAFAQDAPELPPAYPEPAEKPELRPTKCLYARDEIPDSMKDIDITCGYVTVPQDHNDPHDKDTIDLYVVIVPATDKHPSETPLFVLAGGPGQAATDGLWAYDSDYGDEIFPSFSDFLIDRDVVLFDQRGTGKTLPKVVCPADREPEGDEPSAADEASAYDNPYLDCADQLAEEGIDLDTYDNHQSAADIDAVRQALGADRIDILGTSYGTWLALESMRYYPETIRSVVLNSPAPPETQLYDSAAIGHQNALDRVFDACADDPDCDDAYPDLADTYTKVVADLNAEPMLVTYEDPDTGEERTEYANGDVFASLVYELIFFSIYIPYAPPLITSVAAGESELFGALVPLLLTSSDGMSVPLHYAVMCQDEIPYIDRDEVLENIEEAGVSQAVMDDEMAAMDSYTEICDAWDLEPSGEIANEPVVSDIPTLIITGRFDPITPTFDGELLLDDLSNAVLVESPVASHSPLQMSGQCGVDIATAFLEHPRKELDTSCMDDLTLDMSPDPDETTAGSK